MNTLEVLVSHDLLPQFLRHPPYDTVWIHLTLVAIERLQLLSEVFPDIDNGRYFFLRSADHIGIEAGILALFLSDSLHPADSFQRNGRVVKLGRLPGRECFSDLESGVCGCSEGTQGHP